MKFKNFRGAQEEPAKKQESILVSDYMSKNLVTFSTEQTVFQVVELLIHNRISGGPVINENNELVGVITEAECMNQISESRYFNMPLSNTKVKNIMIKEFKTVNANMNIFDASKLFSNAVKRSLPVLSEGKLVGLISRKDVLKAALNVK